MRVLYFLVLVASVFVSSCACFDTILGDTIRKKMVHHERVKTYALPLLKRITSVTYKDPYDRKIQGIAVLDKDFSFATANVTDGGVGYTYVTVRMKSQRSQPLNYELEIYV